MMQAMQRSPSIQQAAVLGDTQPCLGIYDIGGKRARNALVSRGHTRVAHFALRVTLCSDSGRRDLGSCNCAEQHRLP